MSLIAAGCGSPTPTFGLVGRSVDRLFPLPLPLLFLLLRELLLVIVDPLRLSFLEHPRSPCIEEEHRPSNDGIPVPRHATETVQAILYCEQHERSRGVVREHDGQKDSRPIVYLFVE